VGAVAAVVGAIVWPMGLSQVSTAEKKCPTHVGCDQQTSNDGNSGRNKATAGGALVIGGVAVAAGGLLWQFLLNKPKPNGPKTGQPNAPSVAVTPVLGPGAAGVSIARGF
jgi:hypothetical protein